MPEYKQGKPTGLFPFTVSGILFILAGIAILIRLNLQKRLFLSEFDHASLTVFLVVIITLCVLWLLTLCFESFRVHLKGLYRPVKWVLFFIFYPMSILLAMLKLVSRENLQNSLLLFQNNLFLANYMTKKYPNVLILLPHCLQFHDCKVRITRDISDCEECGKCNIKDLKQLGKRFNIKIGIANGGTLARKIVHDSNPDVIIAVACHRDLTEGVRETWKYPVYAILNQRPNGPCFDTCVNVNEVGRTLENILNGSHSQKPLDTLI